MAHASLGLTAHAAETFRRSQKAPATGIAAEARRTTSRTIIYAYALSREGMDEAGRANGYNAVVAREMREHLLKAIELRPDFPESYHLLAFTALVMNDNLDEGVKMLTRARALAPGNEHYALVLAQIYLRQENFDAARKTIEPLARDASDPQLRSHAQSILNAIPAPIPGADRAHKGHARVRRKRRR